MEEWFLTYPELEKEELRSRIRSNDDRQFQSAYFELFLFALLTRLGCTFEVHPAMEGEVTKRPDFLVTSSTGDKFFLEATVATDLSDEEAAVEARTKVVYDAINRVESPNFFIGMEIDGEPRTPPKGRAIRGFLQKKISEIDPDEMSAAYERLGDAALPKWLYRHDGWEITFFPIPKKPEARGKTEVRPLGLQSFAAQWIDSSSAVRASVEKKASRYGELEHPYIIAINALGHSVDREAVLEALLGKERTVVNTSTMTVEQVGRDWNGAWILGKKPKNSRVSGILLANKVCPWSYIHRDLTLFLNPWAQMPYVSDLCKFSRCVPENGKLEFYDGIRVSTVFGEAKV